MPEILWIFVIGSKIKQTLSGWEMTVAEINVMIIVSGNFFCTLRGDQRQICSNILSSRVELLLPLLVSLFVLGFVFVLCVYIYFFLSTVPLFAVAWKVLYTMMQ